jgi:hypothetical protein
MDIIGNGAWVQEKYVLVHDNDYMLTLSDGDDLFQKKW